MALVLKRMSLGVVLLVLASAALLFSGSPRRKEGAAKVWSVHLIAYTEVVDSEETKQGVLEGIRASGLVEGRDYELHITNAQGDMATVSALVDSAVTQNADLIITLSTPTLQAAIRRGKGTPVVFAYVGSGIVAGAGKSDTDHMPNVTGVNLVAGFPQMVALVREHFPGVRRLGTLHVPAEANMVYFLKQFEEAAGAAGFELVVVPVNTATDVPDAAQALVGRGIDAVMQMPGNLVASAFGSIGRAGAQAHLPIFAFQKSQVEQGAMVAITREYIESGRMAGAQAARIIRGENPAKMPFEIFKQTYLVVNPEAARTAGVTIPAALLQQAAEDAKAHRGNH